MKASRGAFGACLALAVAPASSFRALSRLGPPVFGSDGGGVVVPAKTRQFGRPILPAAAIVVAPPRSSPSMTRTSSTTALRGGFLQNFFGGGAYESKIDYDDLPHPCPELARFAMGGKVPVTSERDPSLRAATFAGGCFWGLELHYQRLPGVIHTAAGYAQGREEEPTYDQVSAGATGHTEAVLVYYDPAAVSYSGLLDAFFERVDPTTPNGQGNDRGRQYRTGVYFHNKAQAAAARARFEEEAHKYGPSRAIQTELRAAGPFWPAEKYHQRYLERGGRSGARQSAEKNCADEIRCYG